MLWLENNIINILGILVSGFIGYHVYFLSKKLSLKDSLVHKDEIRKQVETLITLIREGRNSKIELINIKKYRKHYPQDNNLNKDGYTYTAAELKALRFDGIDFFCGVVELYKDKNENFSFESGDGKVRCEENAFKVGIIPYEWIEHVDHRGDEFSYRPQFFTWFKGSRKEPYKYFKYYTKNNTYREGNDPVDFKWKELL